MIGPVRRSTVSPARRRLALVLVLLVGFGVGAVLLVTGLAERSSTLPIAGGIRVEGTVVSVQSSCSRSCSYRPVIRYMVGPASHIFVGAYHGSDPAIGSRELVSYNPAHPATAHDLGGYSTNWMASIVVGCVLLAGASTLVILVGIRGARRRQAQISA